MNTYKLAIDELIAEKTKLPDRIFELNKAIAMSLKKRCEI